MVDDDQWIVQSTAMVLEAAGISALTASDGQQGIELAKEVRPGVILLDVMMPGLDGWATLEALKTDERTREITVIIFSARDPEGNRASRRTLGADAFLQKPFEPSRLLELVQSYLQVAASA